MWLLAGLMLSIAFVFQYSSTAGVTVPVEEDIYRDLGTANALLESWSTADPNLAGEVRWYNPLVPGLVSVISRISGVTPFDVYARIGVFINLLAPIALCLVVARLWSWRAACFALAAYLFLGPHNEMSTHYATYSPWPWPYNFAQGPALLTVLILLWAIQHNRVWVYVVGGVSLGLTFLSHTAPAAVIALTMILFCAFQTLSRQWSWRQSLGALLATGVPALLVSMTMLLPLLLRYRLHMLNPAPAQFTALYLGESIRLLATLRTGVGLLGLAVLFILLITGRRRDPGLTLLMCFALSSGLMFTYGIGADILRGHGTASLPVLVPTFHFYLYFSLSCVIGFGIGLAWIIEHLPPRNTQLATTVVLLAVLVTSAWPGYSRNLDTHLLVDRAHKLAARNELKQLYDWCLQHTRPDDVFLVDDFYGQYGVAAAGRKLLMLDPLFTNPYVDIATRMRDRKLLYDALASGDSQGFAALADTYRIRYVVTSERAMLNGLYTKKLTDTRQVTIAGLALLRDFGAAQVYERTNADF